MENRLLALKNPYQDTRSLTGLLFNVDKICFVLSILEAFILNLVCVDKYKQSTVSFGQAVVKGGKAAVTSW